MDRGYVGDISRKCRNLRNDNDDLELVTLSGGSDNPLDYSLSNLVDHDAFVLCIRDKELVLDIYEVPGFFNQLAVGGLNTLLSKNAVTPIGDTADHLYTTSTVWRRAVVLIVIWLLVFPVVETLFKPMTHFVESLAMWVPENSFVW